MENLCKYNILYQCPPSMPWYWRAHLKSIRTWFARPQTKDILSEFECAAQLFKRIKRLSARKNKKTRRTPAKWSLWRELLNVVRTWLLVEEDADHAPQRNIHATLVARWPSCRWYWKRLPDAFSMDYSRSLWRNDDTLKFRESTLLDHCKTKCRWKNDFLRCFNWFACNIRERRNVGM